MLCGSLLCLTAVVGCRGGVAQSPLAVSAGTPQLASETKTEPAPVQEVKHPAFDGDKAFKQLTKQCDFGPRPLGSPAHKKTRDYLLEEMKKYADKTFTQDFKYRDMDVSNIGGVFYPAGETAPSKTPILLFAHWDTRPIADGPYSSEIRKGVFRFGAKGWNRTTPILGANDGASGVAILLEIARVFKEKRPNVGVVIVFVDGEDYGDFRTGPEGEGVLLGSRYLAKHLKDTPEMGKPSYGILLDMVGAKNLLLPREENSHRFAPGANEKVFGAAQALGYGKTFRFDASQEVIDDHMPLNMAGVPTIDLIHPLPFGEYETTGYRYWHTLEDTPEQCSAQSLKIVGDTIADTLYRETP